MSPEGGYVRKVQGAGGSARWPGELARPVGMGPLPNIDAAAEEKYRVLRVAEETYDDDGLPVADASTLAGATVVWVTRDMAELAREAALSMPDDFEPRREDFGLLPSNMFVGFAGEVFLDNCWHVHVPRGVGDVVWSVWEAGSAGKLRSRWSFGPGTTLGTHFPDEAPGEGWSLLWAFVLLANQQLSHIFRKRPSRHARRRCGDTIESVVVVTLRRLRPARESEDEARSVDWSHRWLVQGHWRNQWYPSQQRNMPLFVSAYVKGPEDKPLIVKGRAFRVSR